MGSYLLRFKMLSKKSQVEDLLSFLFTVIVIFLVVLFFSYTQLNKTKTMREKLNQDIEDKSSTILLLNYLKSEIVYGNKKISVQEAFSYYFATGDNNILPNIIKASEEFFSTNGFGSDWESWKINLDYGGEKQLTIEPPKSKELKFRKEISSVSSPSHYSTKAISIKLYKTSYAEQRTRPLA